MNRERRRKNSLGNRLAHLGHVCVSHKLEEYSIAKVRDKNTFILEFGERCKIETLRNLVNIQLFGPNGKAPLRGSETTGSSASDGNYEG